MNRKTIANHLLDHIKDASAIGSVYNHIVFRPGLSQEDGAPTPSGATSNEGHHVWLIYNALHKRAQAQYACALRFRLRCALLQKKIAQISPQWCLSQQDAPSVRAAAFNPNTFRLSDIDEFEPLSLIQGSQLIMRISDARRNMGKCKVGGSEKSASYVEKEVYVNRYQICKDSDRIAEILARQKQKGDRRPRLPRNRTPDWHSRRRNIHKQVTKVLLKKARSVPA